MKPLRFNSNKSLLIVFIKFYKGLLQNTSTKELNISEDESMILGNTNAYNPYFTFSIKDN